MDNSASNDDESLRDIQTRLQAKNDKQPLIAQVSNHWNEKSALQTDEDIPELSCCDLEHDRSCPNVARGLFTSRRFRRMIAYAIVVLLVIYYTWTRFIQPQMEEEWAYKEGFVAQENGTYGIAKGGDIGPDLVRIKHLDHKFLPGGPSDREGKRRLVFIGDVHGCKKELTKLLDKIAFDEKMDHLILTGDIISKGPDNVGVLDELIRLKATSVRGNHEDRILRIASTMEEGTPPPIQAKSSKGHARDATLVKELKHRHLKYLKDMPLMLHIPALPQALTPTNKVKSPIAEHILVVHAGLVPGVRLDKQDPYFVMNMRSINRRTHVPSAMRDGKNAKPWFDVWGWYNDRVFRRSASLAGFPVSLANSRADDNDSPSWYDRFWKSFFGNSKARPRPQVVVYGHDSKAGLQINRWSKGLDSGCVNGDELTAMVLGANGKYELHSVGCKNYRS